MVLAAAHAAGNSTRSGSAEGYLLSVHPSMASTSRRPLKSVVCGRRRERAGIEVAGALSGLAGARISSSEMHGDDLARKLLGA